MATSYRKDVSFVLDVVLKKRISDFWLNFCNQLDTSKFITKFITRKRGRNGNGYGYCYEFSVMVMVVMLNPGRDH